MDISIKCTIPDWNHLSLIVSGERTCHVIIQTGTTTTTFKLGITDLS